MKKEEICFTKRMETISEDQIGYEFGNTFEKHEKIEKFLCRNKTETPIPIEKLGEYDAALFQNAWQDYSLADIMVDFKIDKEKGEVTAKKLFRCRGEYELETRIYFIDNYGKTWRAWAAIPTREAAEWL